MKIGLPHILFVGLFVGFISTSVWAGSIVGNVTYNGEPKNQAAVYLDGMVGDFSTPETPEVIIQKKQRFIPEVLAVMKGTTIYFPNRDTVVHHAFSLSPAKIFDLGNYGPGKNPSVFFDSLGKVDIFCNKHYQMNASVVVLNHPFFTLTSETGDYEIEGVPPGEYLVKVWMGSFHLEEKKVLVVSPDAARVDFKVSRKKKMKGTMSQGFVMD